MAYVLDRKPPLYHFEYFWPLTIKTRHSLVDSKGINTKHMASCMLVCLYCAEMHFRSQVDFPLLPEVQSSLQVLLFPPPPSLSLLYLTTPLLPLLLIRWGTQLENHVPAIKK